MARRRVARTTPNVREERSEPKVVLLVRLLSAIDDGRYSFEELKDRIADDKPPSTRSLRRYLAVLSDAGFPWYFDRTTATYKFAEGYSLRRHGLDRDLPCLYLELRNDLLASEAGRERMAEALLPALAAAAIA